jgi:hypothetical protein
MECPHQLARQPRRPVAHLARVRRARPSPVTSADGGDAVALDQPEQLLALLLAQDLAHERPERVHVIAQRLMLGREMDVAAVHSGPAVSVRLKIAALHAHDAEALPGRGLHHHPGAHVGDTSCAEGFQTPRFGFDVIRLNVQMYATLMGHLLHLDVQIGGRGL